MIHKLILGTAGLGGQEYAGRTVTREDAKRVINRAWELGLHNFDTAPAYGFAEELLAEAFEFMGCAHIFTKDSERHQKHGRLSLMQPRPSILWHNWTKYCGIEHSDQYVDGVSVYQDEIGNALAEGYGLIECEWNLLRQCAIPDGITFIARSVFGRGLAKKSLIAQEIANALDLDVHQLFLQAALQHPRIDHVIIGPQTIEELEQCVAWSRKPLNFWQVLDVADRKLTDPRLYK